MSVSLGMEIHIKYFILPKPVRKIISQKYCIFTTVSNVDGHVGKLDISVGREIVSPLVEIYVVDTSTCDVSTAYRQLIEAFLVDFFLEL